MANQKRKIIEQVAEKLGWSTSFHSQQRTICNGGKWDKEQTEFYVEFEQSSPAGEDVILTEFYERLDDIPEKLYERYEGFDIDEHVEMWLAAKRNGDKSVPGAAALVEDGKWQEQAILDLSYALRDALGGKKVPV